MPTRNGGKETPQFLPTYKRNKNIFQFAVAKSALVCRIYIETSMMIKPTITYGSIYPQPFPPAWASAWGDDDFGLWAEFFVGEGEQAIVQRMRWIVPGQFLMGSPDTEQGRDLDEGPQHRVTISHGFWLADTACTQAMWKAVMGNSPSKFDNYGRGNAEYPVESVSWNAVQKFMQKLETQLPACKASLPTEAEWEYACRAGSTTPFSFGATISADVVNYRGDAYGVGKKDSFSRHTVAVKGLPANEWGLYQMHGNVWEWCADGKREYTENDVIDPGLSLLPATGDMLILRGGSWLSDKLRSRSAIRCQVRRDVLRHDSGFRLLLRSSS